MLRGPIRFTNALGGTVDFIYPGPTIDMQSPATAGAVNGVSYIYYAQSLDMSEWEVGSGAYTSGTKTFARTTVAANSLGTTAKIDFSDPPQIFVFDTATQFLTQAAADARYLQPAQADARYDARYSNYPGQCRFVLGSATSCFLAPGPGNEIKINGVIYQVPAVGIQITNAGLVANTLYYCYAIAPGGVLSLLWATSPHSSSATAGNIGTEILTGNDDYSLVGAVVTNAAAQFVDTAANRQVRSWFNDSGIIAFNGTNVPSPAMGPTGSFAEIDAAARVTAFLWNREHYSHDVYGASINSTAGSTNYTSPMINGAQTGAYTYVTSAAVNYWMVASAVAAGAVGGDSFVTFSICGIAGSGSATWGGRGVKVTTQRK